MNLKDLKSKVDWVQFGVISGLISMILGSMHLYNGFFHILGVGAAFFYSYKKEEKKS